MSRLTYFRLALLLPLVAPLVVAPLALLAPDVFGPPALVLGASLAFGGVPYTLFAACVLLWSRGRSADRLRGLARWAPVLFAPLAGLGVIAFYVRNAAGPRAAAGLWDDFVVGAGVSLVLGYLYVALVLLVDDVRRDHAVDGAGRPAADGRGLTTR